MKFVNFIEKPKLIKLYSVYTDREKDTKKIGEIPIFINYKLANVISYYPMDIDGKTYNYYSIVFNNEVNSGISNQLDELLDINNAQFK